MESVFYLVEIGVRKDIEAFTGGGGARGTSGESESRAPWAGLLAQEGERMARSRSP